MARPNLHNQKKVKKSITVTQDAWDNLEAIAQKLMLSRSELIEMIGQERIKLVRKDKHMKKYSEEETIAHLKKLAIAYAECLEFLETSRYGVWGVNQKRPFGNSSDVFTDIFEICEIKPEDVTDPEDSDEEEPDFSNSQKRYAEYLYKERLGDFLKQVVISHCEE